MNGRELTFKKDNTSTGYQIVYIFCSLLVVAIAKSCLYSFHTNWKKVCRLMAKYVLWINTLCLMCIFENPLFGIVKTWYSHVRLFWVCILRLCNSLRISLSRYNFIIDELSPIVWYKNLSKQNGYILPMVENTISICMLLDFHFYLAVQPLNTT